MSYLSKEVIREIKKELNKQFPEIKFSVKKGKGGTLDAIVMKSPWFKDGVDFFISAPSAEGIKDEKQKNVILKIDEVIREKGEYYDNSDPAADYFNPAFFYTIQVGTFAKKHEKIEA